MSSNYPILNPQLGHINSDDTGVQLEHTAVKMQSQMETLEKRDEKLKRQTAGIFFGFREVIEIMYSVKKFAFLLFQRQNNLEKRISELESKNKFAKPEDF